MIFDEVITGFRLCIGGAQEYYNVKADIVTYGKIIGGGMPVGAYGGKRDIMECVSPVGGVYQAGTLSGNPIAMAAGLAQLRVLHENREIYNKINMLAGKLEEGFNSLAYELEFGIWVNRVGSLISVFFTGERVDNFRKAKTSNTKLYARYFNHMLKEGVYLAPSQFEAMFVSYAHSEEDISCTIDSARKTLLQMKNEEGF